jgi:hypothetical protein
MNQETINTAYQPFHTTNAILAFCLWRAGVPFWTPEEPCKVVYSIDIIRKFVNGAGKPIFEGWELKKATEAAHKRGLRGRVVYIFRPTIRLSELLKSFTDQEKGLARDDISVEAIIKGIVARWFDGKMENDEALLRLACVDLKTRVEFMELWTKQVPCYEIPNEGEVTKTNEPFVRPSDGKTVMSELYEHPGMRVVSVNASKETLEHLGL